MLILIKDSLNCIHHKDLGNPGIMGHLDRNQLKLQKRQESSFLLTLTILNEGLIAGQDHEVPC